MNRPLQAGRSRASGPADADCRRAMEALARRDFEGAARAYRKAIRRGTRDPHAYNNLGVILAQQGKLAEAIPLFEGALARDAGFEDARRNLAHARAVRGVEHYQAGRLGEAEVDLRAVVALEPGSARAASQLAELLGCAGRRDEAIALYQRSLALDPRDLTAPVNLGALLHAAGRFAEAVPVLERALALAPGQPQAALTLSAVHERLGDLARAEACARQAVAAAPQSAEAHSNLALALSQQGDRAGTLRHFQQAATLAPGQARHHSAVLLTSHYDPDLSPEELFARHRAFDARFGAGAAPRGPRRSAGRLRVGYLSPDLRAHSVAYFFEPLLRAHDRAAVEVTCYADSPAADRVTALLRGHAEHWREVSGLGDAALGERIAADGIDVLVDLAGHTNGNRMALFARRAAPVQFTYLGYPSSTGLGAMDHRVTDAVADPPGAEALHSERLVRLDGGFLCYAPAFGPREGPEVTPPPALARGVVTFGSFNTFIKVNERVLDAWALLLRLVPDARLLLKARALGEAPVRERVAAGLEARGVARDRLDLRPPIPGTAGHLAAYADVDIALDTFPYNGTTTTCEALWMGVPVITFTGRSHVGRVGTSILSRLGLGELAPPTLEGALDAAGRLAADRDRLAELRRTMRDRMLASPLMDARRVAAQLEAAYLGAF